MVPQIIIEIVNEFKDLMPFKSILELFDIPRSTYYRWKNKIEVNEISYDERIVISKCKETNYEYGYRTIKGILKDEGKHLNKNTVQRIMQKFNLQCRVKPKKVKHVKGKESIVASNIIDRDFTANRPLEKLSTDITYLPWGEKTVYLSTIMDLYNGEIIAFSLGDTQDTNFVLDILNQLPEIKDRCILHSDQGTVYTSKIYQETVYKKSITMSMSRRGTPADNAPIESFHSTLKSETFYRYPELKSSNEIISQTVINFIKYYNNTRVQARLDFKSPIKYRESRILG